MTIRSLNAVFVSKVENGKVNLLGKTYSPDDHYSFGQTVVYMSAPSISDKTKLKFYERKECVFSLNYWGDELLRVVSCIGIVDETGEVKHPEVKILSQLQVDGEPVEDARLKEYWNGFKFWVDESPCDKEPDYSETFLKIVREPLPENEEPAAALSFDEITDLCNLSLTGNEDAMRKLAAYRRMLDAIEERTPEEENAFIKTWMTFQKLYYPNRISIGDPVTDVSPSIDLDGPFAKKAFDYRVKSSQSKHQLWEPKKDVA